MLNRALPLRFLFVLATLWLAGCARQQSAAPEYTVTVDADEFDRRGTPVSFAVPLALVGGEIRLVDEEDRAIPVQPSGDGAATFILGDLPAGKTARYLLRRGEPAPVKVVAHRESGGITLKLDGQPVIRYNADETELPRPGIDPVFRRGGYIHPVHTPSGKVITEDYPENHLHHHGIWAAWTKTEFEGRHPDFWNMGERTGTVEPVALDTTWSGSVHGGFRARHRYVDLTAPTPKDALHESWTVRVFDAAEGTSPHHLFDLNVVQTTAGSSPLVLPEYHYGGVGFRGLDEWNGEENTFFLTSEGKTRADGHATRARWAHISGSVDGELAGVAILSHPENFRFPQPMRIHPSEPFFNWAPSQGGSWSIQPGRPYRARYRFVVFDGAPDPRELDRLWNDFAHPPQVVIKPR